MLIVSILVIALGGAVTAGWSYHWVQWHCGEFVQPFDKFMAGPILIFGGFLSAITSRMSGGEKHGGP